MRWPPYRRFLKYLAFRKANVRRVLKEIALPDVDVLFLVTLLAGLCETAPPLVYKYLNGRSRNNDFVKDEAFRRWAESEGIQPFLPAESQADSAVDGATNILLNRVDRTLVGTLLLARIPPPDIVAIAKERSGLVLDLPTIAKFDELFWQSAMRVDWLENIGTFAVDQQHYLARALERSLTVDDVRRLLGLESASDMQINELVEVRDLTRTYVKKLLRSDSAIALQGADVLCRLDKYVRDLQRDATQAVQQGGAFDLFSVQVERLPIRTLADLDGEVSSRA